MTNKSLRFDEISIMRVMAMLMIIVFHSMCFYNGRWVKFDAITIPFWYKLSTFLDSIDLNMFVFISGYLYGYLYIYRNKYHHPSEVILNKTIRLLVPYCIWGFVMTLFPFSVWPMLFYGISHLWFLLMLFGVFTLTVVLQLLNAQRFKFTYKTGLALIVSAYILMYAFQKFINPKDMLCANRVLYYFQAFMIGYVCAKLKIGWVMPGWSFVLLPLALVVLFVFVWYPLPIPYVYIRLVRSLCSYTICVCLLIILSKVTLFDWARAIIQRIENLSMGIYIFNQISLDLVLLNTTCNDWFREHWMIGPFFLFLIGFFPPLLLASVFYRYKALRWTIGG